MTLQQNIYFDALSAVAVTDFLKSLPDTLGRHLFRHILDQGFEQASVFSREDLSDKLCSAIIYCYNPQKISASYAFSCLGGALCLEDKDTKESIKEPDKLRELVGKSREKRLEVSLEVIKEKMLCAYECFTPAREEKMEDVYVDKLGAILMELNESYHTGDPSRYNLDHVPDYLSENPFESLGYLTFYDQFTYPFDDPATMSIENEKKKKRVDKFITWYCRGHLIDHVLDFIYIHHIPALSRSMMGFLQKSCESNAVLFNVVQKRHDVMKKMDSSIPALNFTGPRLDISEKNVEYRPVELSKIKKTTEGNEPITRRELCNIFNSLVKEKFIEHKDLATFLKVFSGEKTYISSRSTITWKKSQQELARFLFLASGLNKVSDNYVKNASSVFCRRNGDPCKLETLSRRYYVRDDDDVMLKIFMEEGIQR